MVEEEQIILKEMPEWMLPYLASEALQRLKKVDMNCGVNYTSFPLFKNIAPYSRYTHSVHTAALAWYFTKNKVQTLACLFHDIATPAFAHTIDFLNGDYMKQESTEEKTKYIIETDPLISQLLQKEGIPISAVSDYHMYPIADNDSPKLSCDRLEYTMGNALNYGFATPSDIQAILMDIIPGKDELIFQHSDPAHMIGMLSIECGKIYCCDADRYSMERLARLIHKAMRFGILNESDLYRDEEKVIQKLQESTLNYEWKAFTKLHVLQVYQEEEPESIQVITKKRYIDPLLASKGRLSDVDPQYQQELDAYLKMDQKVWMRGE